MAGNFDFLHHHPDLKYYEASAKNLEQLYGIGSYIAMDMFEKYMTDRKNVGEDSKDSCFEINVHHVLPYSLGEGDKKMLKMRTVKEGKRIASIVHGC